MSNQDHGRPLIVSRRDVLGGVPVFGGTRVPVTSLFDHLIAGDRLDDFLHDFPSVSRSAALAVLRRSHHLIDDATRNNKA